MDSKIILFVILCFYHFIDVDCKKRDCDFVRNCKEEISNVESHNVESHDVESHNVESHNVESHNVESHNIDSIFVGKIVEIFHKSSHRKRDRKKRKRNSKTRHLRNPGNCKCSKKIVSGLVDVKRVYLGEEETSLKRPFVVVEGFSGVDNIGDTKLFLTKKLFDGVYRIARATPNRHLSQKKETKILRSNDSFGSLSTELHGKVCFYIVKIGRSVYL
jgi:hypothetical protein